MAAEPDLCGRLKCAHFDKCFLFRARRAAAKADVIVVNHHLLMSDIAVRRAQQNWSDAAVLPAYRRLVIDEAHHIEDAAASHLGTTVTRRALIRLLNRLDRKGKGLLPALTLRLSAQRDLLSTASLDLVRMRLAPAVGVHGLVGGEGVVRREGLVSLNGELWRARSGDDRPLVPGEHVRVERVEDDLQLVVGSVTSPTGEEPS